MGSERPVIVYDPNTQNPYGQELARVIATDGSKVQLICARQFPAGAPRAIDARPVLDARAGPPSLARAVRRLIGPLRALRAAGTRGSLIIVWTSDWWDASVFALWANIRRRTYLVFHNPIEGRMQTGLRGRALTTLARHATAVVHHADLERPVTLHSKKVRVAPHPTYQGLVTAHTWSHENVADRRTVTFIGAMRDDKGIHELPEIVRSAGADFTFAVLTSDPVPPELLLALVETGVNVKLPHTPGELSDAELIAGLRETTVMIAPYRAVTESGTIVLAHTLDVPVLAYDSAAIRRRLSADSIAATPQELGRLVRHFLASPWPTFERQADTVDEQCARAWHEILGEQ